MEEITNKDEIDFYNWDYMTNRRPFQFEYERKYGYINTCIKLHIDGIVEVIF